MRVLLSIKPEYVDRIFDGSKLYEYRRRMFANKAVKTVVVYATKPIGKIVGEFDIENIICSHPEKIWTETQISAGIHKAKYDEYFAGREIGFAIKIGQVRPYRHPLCPNALIANFTPPQSYMYLADQTSNRFSTGDQFEMVV